jgi:hypothetical protein
MQEVTSTTAMPAPSRRSSANGAGTNWALNLGMSAAPPAHPASSAQRHISIGDSASEPVSYTDFARERFLHKSAPVFSVEAYVYL